MKYNSISIIVSVYNKEKTINLIIDGIINADTLELDKEIIT